MYTISCHPVADDLAVMFPLYFQLPFIPNELLIRISDSIDCQGYLIPLSSTSTCRLSLDSTSRSSGGHGTGMAQPSCPLICMCRFRNGRIECACFAVERDCCANSCGKWGRKCYYDFDIQYKLHALSPSSSSSTSSLSKQAKFCQCVDYYAFIEFRP